VPNPAANEIKRNRTLERCCQKAPSRWEVPLSEGLQLVVDGL
jgi:hypothetical protein